MTMQHQEDADFPSTVMAETVSDCDMVNVASDRDFGSSSSEHSSSSPLLSDADYSLSLDGIEPQSGVANLAESTASVACIDDAESVCAEKSKATKEIELVRSRVAENTVESSAMKDGVKDTQSGALSVSSNAQDVVTISSHLLNDSMSSSEAILNISSSKNTPALGITDALQSKSALSAAELSKKALTVTQDSVTLNAAQAAKNMLPQESLHSVHATHSVQSTSSLSSVKDGSALVDTSKKQGLSGAHPIDNQMLSGAYPIENQGVSGAAHQVDVKDVAKASNLVSEQGCSTIVNVSASNASEINLATHDVLAVNNNRGTESNLSKTLEPHSFERFECYEGSESTDSFESVADTERVTKVGNTKTLSELDAAVDNEDRANLDAAIGDIAPRMNINGDEQFSAIKGDAAVNGEAAIRSEAVVIENGVSNAMSEVNAANRGSDLKGIIESQMADGSETESFSVDDEKSIDNANLYLATAESAVLANAEYIALATAEPNALNHAESTALATAESGAASTSLTNAEPTALSSSGTIGVGHASEIAPFPIYSQPYTQPQELNTVIEETDSFGVSKQIVNDNSKCGHMPCFFIFDYAADRFLLDAGSCRLLGLTYTGEWIPSHFIEKQITIIEDEQYFNVLFTRDYGDLLLQTVRVNHGEHEGDLIYMSGSVLQRDDTGIALVVAGYLSRIQVNFVEYLSRIKNNSSAFDFDVVTGEIHYGPAYKDLLGYKDSKDIPSYLISFEKTLIHPDDLPIFKRINDIIENPQGGYYYEAIFRLQHKSGFYLWCISRGLIVERDGSGRATRIIGTTTNIDILRSNFERLKRSIYQDPLTGLHNRLYLNTRYKYFTMEESQPLSLVYADISGLKLINDYLGHSNGDTLVKLAAQILQNDIYLDHEVVRLSGDEFLLIFTACPAVECRLFINKFTVELNERNKYQEFPVPIFFGFGIATLYEIGHDDTFLRCEARADARLQEYKKAHHDYIYSALRAFLETTLGQNIDLTDNRRLDYLDHNGQQNQQSQQVQQGLNGQLNQQSKKNLHNQQEQQGVKSHQADNSHQSQRVCVSGQKQTEQNQSLGAVQHEVKQSSAQNQNVSAGQGVQVQGTRIHKLAAQSGQLEQSAQLTLSGSNKLQSSLGKTIFGHTQQFSSLNATSTGLTSSASMLTRSVKEAVATDLDSNVSSFADTHTVASLYGATDEDGWDVSGQSTADESKEQAQVSYGAQADTSALMDAQFPVDTVKANGCATRESNTTNVERSATKVEADTKVELSSTNVENNDLHGPAINAALNIALDAELKTSLNSTLSADLQAADNASRYMSYLDECLARLQAGYEGASYSGYVPRKPVYHSIHRPAVYPSTVQSTELQEGYSSEQRVATSQVDANADSYVVASADLVDTSQSVATQAVVEPSVNVKGELSSLVLTHADTINANANTYECLLDASAVTTPSISNESNRATALNDTTKSQVNSSSDVVNSAHTDVLTEMDSFNLESNSDKGISSGVYASCDLSADKGESVVRDLSIAHDSSFACESSIAHDSSVSYNSSDNGSANVVCDSNAKRVLSDAQCIGNQSNLSGLKQVVSDQSGIEHSLQSENSSSLTTEIESTQTQHDGNQQSSADAIKQNLQIEQVEPLQVSESLVSDEAGLDNLSYVDALSYPHHDVHDGSHLNHILQMLQHGESLSPDEDIPVKSSDFSNNQKSQWAKSWLDLINDGHDALQVPDVSVSDLKPEVIAAAEHAVFLEDEYARRAIDNLPEDLTPNTTIRPIEPTDKDEVQSTQAVSDQSSVVNGQDHELYTESSEGTEEVSGTEQIDDTSCDISGEKVYLTEIAHKTNETEGTQQINTTATNETSLLNDITEGTQQSNTRCETKQTNSTDSTLQTSTDKVANGTQSNGTESNNTECNATEINTTESSECFTQSVEAAGGSNAEAAASNESTYAARNVSYEQAQILEREKSSQGATTNCIDQLDQVVASANLGTERNEQLQTAEKLSDVNVNSADINVTSEDINVTASVVGENLVPNAVSEHSQQQDKAIRAVIKLSDTLSDKSPDNLQGKLPENLLDKPLDNSQDKQDALKANYAIEVGAANRQTTSALVMINQHNVERELSRQVSDSMETDLTSSGAALIKEHQGVLSASEEAMLNAQQHAYIGQLKTTICSDEAQPSVGSSMTDMEATGRTRAQAYAGYGMCGALGAADGIYASLDSSLERRAETANVIAYENKALDQELLGSIAAAYSSNGVSDVHDNLSNESVEASSKVDASQLVLGYWYYRGKDQSFLLDKQCADYYGLPYSNEWIHEDVMLQCIESLDKERYYKVMHSLDMGSIIFENIMLKNPRWKNKHFVIDGSVLSRFPDSSVRYAVGYLTQVESSFSELIAHEIAGDGFFTWDQESGCLHFSSSTPHVQGRGQNEFNCSFYEWLRDMVHPDDIEILDVERNIFVSANYGDNFEFCIRLRQLRGNYIWSIARGIVLKRNEVGQATSVIGTLSNINLIRDNFENIKQLLYTDTLTGLHNRSYFQHHMTLWQDEMLQPVSVIYADITGLKITNDVLGHADGDALIMAVTDALTMVLDSSCDIMRLSGDEFLVVMPHCDKELSLQRIDELQDYLKERNKQPGVMPVFIGFGRATMGEVPQDTLHACIERADVRMQKVKEEKRSENYKALQKYLEMRKGRPVSMRDGRRLEYYSDEERKQASIRNASGKPAAITKTPY